MTDEMRSHLHASAEDLVRTSLSPGQAERRARIAFGGIEPAKAACRSARRLNWVLDLAGDVRHAVRLIARQPVFSAAAVAMLAIGIGGATTVFTLVNAVLLRSLPFREPDRLVWMYNARTERDRAPFSIADLDDYTREASTLDAVAPFINWTANLTGAGEPERLEGTRVSGAFFPLLGATPLLGRTLLAGDESTDAKVTVLTHGLWTRRFGADRHIVGRSVILNGAAYSVVGVLPARFLFPFRDAELAVPLTLRDDPRRADRGANFLRVVARLKRGVRELAIRSALGADARGLVLLMLREELAPVVLGLEVGLAIALAGSRLLGSALFETSPWDPRPYAMVAGTLIVVGALAAYLPVRQASTASPADLLRS